MICVVLVTKCFFLKSTVELCHCRIMSLELCHCRIVSLSMIRFLISLALIYYIQSIMAQYIISYVYYSVCVQVCNVHAVYSAIEMTNNENFCDAD